MSSNLCLQNLFKQFCPQKCTNNGIEKIKEQILKAHEERDKANFGFETENRKREVWASKKVSKKLARHESFYQAIIF